MPAETIHSRDAEDCRTENKSTAPRCSSVLEGIELSRKR